MGPLRTAAAIVGSVGLVTLAAACFLVGNRLGQIQKWKGVDAQVSRAWIEEDPGSEDTRYKANYELSYIVDGKPIRSKATSEDSLLAGREAVKARIARHAAGTWGRVFVNPEDPKQARLNLGRNAATLGWPLWLILAGVSLLSIGGSLWWMGAPGHTW